MIDPRLLAGGMPLRGMACCGIIMKEAATFFPSTMRKQTITKSKSSRRTLQALCTAVSSAKRAVCLPKKVDAATRQAAEAVAAVQVRPATAAEKGIQLRATSCPPTIRSSSICLANVKGIFLTRRRIANFWKMLPMIQTPIMGRTGGENSGMHGCKKTAARFGFVQETVSFKTAELTKYHTSMMNERALAAATK